MTKRKKPKTKKGKPTKKTTAKQKRNRQHVPVEQPREAGLLVPPLTPLVLPVLPGMRPEAVAALNEQFRRMAAGVTAALRQPVKVPGPGESRKTNRRSD